MFELNKQHQKLKTQIAPMLDFLAQSVLANAFNQPAAGHVALDSLLNNQTYQEQLGLGNISNLIMLKAHLYEVEHNYSDAAALLQSYLQQTAQVPIGGIRGDMQKALSIYQALAGEPSLQVKRPNTDCTVPYFLEKAGRHKSIKVNCTINGIAQHMIFDTGCPKYNYIDEQLAHKLGLKHVLDSIPMQGIGKGFAWLGMADSLSIGEITFYHPLFYVVDHTSPDMPVSVDAVLGSYLLNQIGEFHLQPQQSTLTFPTQTTPRPNANSNLVMHNRHLFFEVKHNNTAQLILFDTGNVKSYMNTRYYTKHKDWVTNHGLADTLKFGGFGGVSVQPGYKIPTIRFQMGETPVDFVDLEVSTAPLNELWVEQGNFGVDFIQLYKKVIVNYHEMFIQLER